MLDASARRLRETLAPDAVVLDVGGAALPFARADWVMDICAYEDRGQLGGDVRRPEQRFGPDTWVQRDICAREPWPFEDDFFDFAICSHTLEDVRDPVWVCAELQRVSRAGYIEVPTIRQELTFAIQGPWTGWGHHHWLAQVQEGGIDFVFKHHVVHADGRHLPPGSIESLSPSERVQCLWWEGSFAARERLLLTAQELDGFIASLVGSGPPPTTKGKGSRRAKLAALARWLHR